MFFDDDVFLIAVKNTMIFALTEAAATFSSFTEPSRTVTFQKGLSPR